MEEMNSAVRPGPTLASWMPGQEGTNDLGGWRHFLSYRHDHGIMVLPGWRGEKKKAAVSSFA